METHKNVFSQQECETLVQDILQDVHGDPESFVEIQREHSQVIQCGPYRIVVVAPPLSKRLEITAVRPVTSRTLEQYKLEESLEKRLLESSR
jgi:ATPase